MMLTPSSLLACLPEDRSPQVRGDNIWICCPWHAGGRETTPSLSINVSSDKFQIGFWHCFGCGKSGMWNTLAQALRLPPAALLPVATPINDALRTRLLGSKRVESFNTDELTGAWTGDWRGIRGDLLKELGAVSAFLVKYSESRIKLPVVIDGNLQGAIYASPVKTSRSYLYSPGSWIEGAVFPYDHVRRMLKTVRRRVILIGEGPRDALNPIQYGLPALAILATQARTFTAKVGHVMALEPDLVLIATDPDEAGVKAAKRLAAAFKGLCRTVRLRMGDMDPGEFSADIVRDLKKEFCHEGRSHRMAGYRQDQARHRV